MRVRVVGWVLVFACDSAARTLGASLHLAVAVYIAVFVGKEIYLVVESLMPSLRDRVAGVVVEEDGHG